MKENKNEHVHQVKHNHCHCHCNCNSHNIMNKPNTNSCSKRYLIEKFIFIPIIIIKILSSLYLYEKYFCYNLQNETDIKYSQKSFFIFVIFLLILYFVSILSSSVQTDIDRYTPLNKNNKEKFEFKQNYLLCSYCHKVKFIRTSHCRVCDKCISFRDHHCPFVTNCIGFNNMQYFLNFCIWGTYGLIFTIYSYFKFKYINLSLSMRIFIKIDFIGNILFLLTLLGIIIRNLITIYNNKTYLESIRQIAVETKCPFYDFLKEKNKNKLFNTYNIGFLNHFFYIIGPTLLHLILPLPKMKNYTLDENCPIFAKIKTMDRMQLIKYNVSKNPNYLKEQVEDTSNPDNFINLCHVYYDGKIIN